MGSNYLASIRYDDTQIVESFFWCNRDIVLNSDDVTAELHVITESPMAMCSDSEWHLPITLDLEIQTYDIEGDEMMHIHLVLDGGSHAPDFDGCDGTYADKVLFINALTVLYEFARTHIATLTGLSAAERFSIPAISYNTVYAEARGIDE